MQQVPDLPPAADYVDLAFTTRLRKLPKLPDRDEQLETTQQTRTLYLYGSGVLAPPASEQGASPTTNVAVDTREYQDEVALVGSGSVLVSRPHRSPPDDTISA